MSIDYDKIMSYLKGSFKIGESIDYNAVVGALQAKSELLNGKSAREIIESLSVQKGLGLIDLEWVPVKGEPDYPKYTYVTILPEGLEKAVDSENPTLGEALKEARSIFSRCQN